MDAMQVYEDAHGIFLHSSKFSRPSRPIQKTFECDSSAESWRFSVASSCKPLRRRSSACFPLWRIQQKLQPAPAIDSPWQLMSRPYIIINSVGDWFPDDFHPFTRSELMLCPLSYALIICCNLMSFSIHRIRFSLNQPGHVNFIHRRYIVEDDPRKEGYRLLRILILPAADFNKINNLPRPTTSCFHSLTLVLSLVTVLLSCSYERVETATETRSSSRQSLLLWLTVELIF